MYIGGIPLSKDLLQSMLECIVHMVLSCKVYNGPIVCMYVCMYCLYMHSTVSF